MNYNIIYLLVVCILFTDVTNIPYEFCITVPSKSIVECQSPRQNPLFVHTLTLIHNSNFFLYENYSLTMRFRCQLAFLTVR